MTLAAIAWSYAAAELAGYRGSTGSAAPRPGSTVPDVAWSYPHPLPAVEPVRGLLAFFSEVVQLVVDGVPEADR